MSSEHHNKRGSTPFDPKRPYQPGQDPAADAWYTTFFIENHLDYLAYPAHVAPPEQVRFMVYADEDRYFPCSDRMFYAIMRRENRPFLQKKYEKVLDKIVNLIDQQIEDPWEKVYLKTLVKTKYKHETRDGIMIPSRLEKRLLGIYLNRTQIEDPCLHEKAQRNMHALRVLKSQAFRSALNHVDDSVVLSAPVGLEQIKGRVDYLKLRRLFALSVESQIWESDEMSQYTEEDYLRFFARPIKGQEKSELTALKIIFGVNDKETKSWSGNLEVSETDRESPIIRAEVLGQFPKQGNRQFISTNIVEAAQLREIIADTYAPLIMGVDVARFGDDSSVIRFRQGRDAKSYPAVKFKNRDNMFMANEIAKLIDHYKPDAVNIDAGNGTGVIDRLRELRYKVHEVWFGGKSSSKEWANKRTEMYAVLREWLNGGCIDNDTVLFGDLTAPEYDFFGKAKDSVMLESKESMKDRGERSPDDGDALALTFARRVSRRDTRTSRHGTGRARVALDVDYPLFS